MVNIIKVPEIWHVQWIVLIRKDQKLLIFIHKGEALQRFANTKEDGDIPQPDEALLATYV